MTFDPAILLLGLYSKELLTCTDTQSCLLQHGSHLNFHHNGIETLHTAGHSHSGAQAGTVERMERVCVPGRERLPDAL